MPIEGYVVVAGTEFRRVAAALEAIDASIPKGLDKALQDGADDGISEARNRVRALELPGGPVGRRGLQNVVAQGVFKTGGRVTPETSLVRINTSMPKNDEAIIPRGMDRLRGWRHPVFGHRDRWVVQTGRSWFIDSMQGMREPIENAMTEVLEDAAQTVDRAGGSI